MSRAWELEFGGREPQAIGRLIGEVVDGQMARKMSDNQRAAAAWYRANGDRERAHTMGVFLRAARVPGAAPILGVYVDSHAMATDFGVNKDLYLGRLANIGFAVSGIEFRVSRAPRRKREQTATHVSQAPAVLPELTPEEQTHVHELVALAPPALQESVSKAVTNSLKREKWEKSHTDASR